MGHGDNLLTPEKVARIIELHNAGLNPGAIRAASGISNDAILRHLKLNGLVPHKYQDRLTAEQKSNLVKEYKEGATCKALGPRYGLSDQCVRKTLARLGVKRRHIGWQPKTGNWNPRIFNQEQEKEICKQYLSGESMCAIARGRNVNLSVIQHIIKRNNIQKRPQWTISSSNKKARVFIDRHGKRHLFRSTWEAALASYLDSKEVEWTYEGRGYPLSNGRTYVPDFEIPEWNQIVEMKGYFRKDSKQKVILFREEYPEKNLVVVDEQALSLYGIQLLRKGPAFYKIITNQ